MHRAPARRGRVKTAWASSPAAAICPARWRKASRDAGRDVFVVALRGMCGDWAEDFPHEWVSLGEPGRALKALEPRGRDRCAAGGPGGAAEILRTQARCQGRDGAAARDGGGAPGRRCAAAHAGGHVRARRLSRRRRGGSGARTGVRTKARWDAFMPDDDHKADIARAFAIVRALGALDVGQAAVVCEGLALAVEAAEGTDADDRPHRPACAKSCAARRTKSAACWSRRLKPTQDAKTDMPVIGVETVRNAPPSRACRHRAGSGQVADRGQAGGGGRSRPAGPVRDRRRAVTPADDLMLVCGEPSGDQLGAQLMAGHQSSWPATG